MNGMISKIPSGSKIIQQPTMQKHELHLKMELFLEKPGLRKNPYWICWNYKMTVNIFDVRQISEYCINSNSD